MDTISIFDPHSREAWRLYHLNIYFIIASSFILLVVIVLVIYASFKFRAKPDDPEPKQFSNNKKVETAMIGIPFLMVAFFFYLTIDVMYDTEPDPKDQTPTVVVTGKQWWWHVSYPGTSVVTANEVHLPVGRRVLLQLESGDVIHDWWIPSLGAKRDLIPGYRNHLWITIDKPGVYEGACAEFCGQQHAWMRIKVIAQEEEDYKGWLEEKARKSSASAAPRALLGAAIFQQGSCSSCHSIRGTPAAGQAGPDLTHLASRSTILAGRLPNNKENLRKFLRNPPKVKPGVHMPRFIYKQDTIDALVEYLSSLK